MDLTPHKCMIEIDEETGEVAEGISLRDEDWETAQAVIRAAFYEGYICSMIDDAFILFPVRKWNPEECITHPTPESVIEAAREWWDVE